jgi:hypothetical protein
MVPTMKKGKEFAFDFCFWWGCYSTKQKLQTRSGKKTEPDMTNNRNNL